MKTINDLWRAIRGDFVKVIWAYSIFSKYEPYKLCR